MTRWLLALACACGGIPQAKECEQFLACSEAVSPMSTTTSASKQTYGPGGTCWQNESDAAACTDICAKGTLVLKMMDGRSKPECQ